MGDQTETKKVVMVVEDEADMRSALETKLTEAGYHVHPILNGEEALRYLQEAQNPKPDVLILDLFTHSVHGIHVLQRLRATPDSAHIPCIILTNIDNQTQKNKAAALGAQYVLKADTSLAEVVNKVNEALLR